MSVLFRTLLEQIRLKPKAVDPNHYIFLLGTSVNFVKQPDKAYPAPYIRGETFSFAAQATVKLLNQKGTIHENHDKAGTAHYAHAFYSESVDVINGPDVGAFEAGDRIAKALLLSLTAIAKGQTTINISGFSRGAVEAIVLTHELARVKKALEDDAAGLKKQTLAQIIKESNSVPGLSLSKHPSYTRASLIGLLAQPDGIHDDKELKQNLLASLSKLEVNLFLLDPVPGGNLIGLPIGWDESTFYFLPDFVKSGLELVQQHETSHCFKAIIPKGMPYEIIPGSHGTGDGNQFSNKLEPIVADKKDVSAVQDLVLQRWLEFMPIRVAAARNNPVEKPKKLVKGHEQLSDVTDTYLQANTTERDKLLLKTYQKIAENHPAFVFLAGRCYKGLGQNMPIRHVHFEKHGSIPITDLHSHGNTHDFVNVQHVQLWLNQRIASFNFANKPLDQQIAWLKDIFEAVFNAAQQQIAPEEDLSASKESERNLIQAIIKMAHDEKQAGLLIEAMVTLSNELILTYLRNHLGQAELDICHDYFKQTIKILDNASNHQTMAKKVKTAIEIGLTTNLDQHCRALFAQSQGLLHESVFLISKSPDAAATAEDEQFALHSQQRSWFANTERLLGELTILARQFDILLPYCHQHSLKKSLTDLINIQSTANISNDLEQAVRRSIEQTITLLHSQAAQILVNNTALLNNKPQGVTPEFFQQMCRLSYHVGAKLNEVIKAKQTAKLIAAKLEQANEYITHHEKSLENAQSVIVGYKEQLATEQHVHKQSSDATELTIDSLRHDLTEERDLHQQDNDSAAQHIDRLTTELQNEREQHQQDNDEALHQCNLLSHDVQERQQAQDIARQNIDSLNQHITDWQNPVEQQHIVTIVALQEKTNAYLLHLQGQKTGSALLESKKEIIANLKTILDDTTVLPSMRLQQFTDTLDKENTQQTISTHRDSAWLRFVRDCIRIIAVAVSGLGMYRAITGSPTQFFRPSHGETFLEDVDLTIKPST